MEEEEEEKKQKKLLYCLYITSFDFQSYEKGHRLCRVARYTLYKLFLLREHHSSSNTPSQNVQIWLQIRNPEIGFKKRSEKWENYFIVICLNWLLRSVKFNSNINFIPQLYLWE